MRVFRLLSRLSAFSIWRYAEKRARAFKKIPKQLISIDAEQAIRSAAVAPSMPNAVIRGDEVSTANPGRDAANHHDFQGSVRLQVNCIKSWILQVARN